MYRLATFSPSLSLSVSIIVHYVMLDLHFWHDGSCLWAYPDWSFRSETIIWKDFLSNSRIFPHTIKTALHHRGQEHNTPPQPVICKQKSKSARWQTEPRGPWVAGVLPWAPDADAVSGPFRRSRCIVHLLSWLLLQVWSHQLMSRTVFRLKQLWATYWENGVWGGSRLESGIQSKQKNKSETRGRLDEGARKNLKTIKGNTNIINPVIMVQYMSSSLSVPPELLSPSTMSLD